MELHTERLRLRPWLAADREPSARLNADPRVMEFFPALLSSAESDALADHPLRRHVLYRTRGGGPRHTGDSE